MYPLALVLHTTSPVSPCPPVPVRPRVRTTSCPRRRSWRVPRARASLDRRLLAIGGAGIAGRVVRRRCPRRVEQAGGSTHELCWAGRVDRDDVLCRGRQMAEESTAAHGAASGGPAGAWRSAVPPRQSSLALVKEAAAKAPRRGSRNARRAELAQVMAASAIRAGGVRVPGVRSDTTPLVFGVNR